MSTDSAPQARGRRPATGALRSALASRDLRRYIAGNAFSLLGTWTQRITVGWLAFELTGSGAWLGIVAAADLLPALVVGPLAGALADRHDRRVILLGGQLAGFAVSAALCAAALAGWLDIVVLVTLVAVGGTVTAFVQPARLAFVPSLVARDAWPAAVALNSIIFNLARFAGPALAGVLIVNSHVASAFALNSLSFIAFAAALGRIEASSAAPREAARGGLLRDVAAGAAHAMREPLLATVLALALAVAVGARPVFELLPGIAATAFATNGAASATALSILASSTGAGALLAGIAIAASGTRSVYVAIAAFACGVIATGAFALSHELVAGAACCFALGAAFVTGGVLLQVSLHDALEDRWRARVLSLYGLVLRAGPALGALAMGVAAEAVGFGPPLLVGTALAGVACALALHRLRQLPSQSASTRSPSTEVPTP